MDKLFSQRIAELGVTQAEFTRRSGISAHTLKRIDEGDPRVKASTLAKAQRTLAAIELELNTPIVPRKAANESP